MPKRFLIAFALLLFLSQALAISAQDAINFATQQNNFLYSGEIKSSYPIVRISDKSKDYWVITLFSGDTLSGFIPIYDKTPTLPDSTVSRRNLIKTAYFLQYYLTLKADVAAEAKLLRLNLWPFDAASVSDFLELSADFKNEKTDLTTVKYELKDFPALQQDIDSLIFKLDEMRDVADNISDSLSETTSFQTSFETRPDTNALNEFEKKVNKDFSAITGLDALLIHDPEEKQLSYLEELEALRQKIASADLPFQTKQGLNSLLNVPSNVQKFISKSNFLVGLKDKFDQIFNNAQANVDRFALDLSTREKRNNAMQALYGMDEEILDKTGEGSLDQLMALLSDEAYVYAWKNQADLANAKADWEKAKAFYEAGSFEQVGQNAASAKKYAINVYAEGIKESEPVIQTDLLFTGVVLLIIAVIIIYALKNRKKFSGLVSGSEEEVEVHGWNE